MGGGVDPEVEHRQTEVRGTEVLQLTRGPQWAGAVARHFRREEWIPRSNIVRQKSVELRFSSSPVAHRSPFSESGKELTLKTKPNIPNFFKPAACSTPNKMDVRVDQKQRKEEEEVTLISTTWIYTKPSRYVGYFRYLP